MEQLHSILPSTAIVADDVSKPVQITSSMPTEELLLKNNSICVALPVVPDIEIAEKNEKSLVSVKVGEAEVESGPHKLWKHAGHGGKLKYTSSNVYVGTGVSKADTRRTGIQGIEVRDLPVGHLLCGEQGLFATRRFEAFNVVGEYCGVIVPKTEGGHYVASLEDKEFDESVGVNAEFCGNEMRFINHYTGIGPEANVKMVTAYIDSLPHLVIVCKRDIEIGEEFLLDYGESYTSAFFKPKDVRVGKMVAWGAFPGNYCSDDETKSDSDEGGV